MTKKSRTRHDAAFKAKVALEAVKEAAAAKVAKRREETRESPAR